MRVYSIYLLIVCLSSGLVRCSVNDNEFIDPLDMLNYDRSTASMRRSRTQETSNNAKSVHDDRCTVFVSRFINSLLQNTGLSSKQKNQEELKSYTLVKISDKDLQSLKNMASNRNIDYVEIDRILNSMFTPFKKSMTDKYEGTSFNEIKGVLFWIFCGLILLLTLYVISKQIHFVLSYTFVFSVIIILAFASTWYSMYMKAVINRNVHLDHMPAHCQHTGGSWLHSSWFRRHDIEECKRFREAIILDPKYSISVTEVLSEMLSKIITKPIESLGESIYGFNKSVLKDIPFWAQILIVPIIIVIFIKSFLLAIALLVGRSLSMKSVFGYGGTSIGSGPTINDQNNTYSRTNNNTQPTTRVLPTITHMPQIPKVNLNINLFHPSNIVDDCKKIENNTSFLINNKLKTNKKNLSNLIEMLKNKEIDSVDSKNADSLAVKRYRHRTLSF
ncbi:uncharacterized protein LOC112684937 [Sipha flava]|uniref:Chloride channel CLIC-like protein 1 n=1 Tax=Sipha flava TaxID=143950 RepID=A0A8B8FNE4_9HEMI|nr:uncharacterized protein LOC112684937 [Sipha flava]